MSGDLNGDELKTSTPSKSVLYLIAFFYLYCGLLILGIGSADVSALVNVVGAFAVLGGIGVFLRRQWSTHAILVPSLYVIAKMALMLIEPLAEGSHTDPAGVVFFALVIFGAACCPYLVYRFLKFELEKA